MALSIYNIDVSRSNQTEKSPRSNPEVLPKKRAKILKGINEYFTEYSNNTSLHGIKYIGEKKLTVWERVFWLVLFITAVVCCSFLIGKTYRKWKTSPVIVSFSQTPTPISDIPFPAVTICPESKVRGSLYNYTELVKKAKHKNFTKEETEAYSKISLVCDYVGPVGLHKNFTLGEDIYDFLLNMSPNNLFYECTWNSFLIPCKKYFTSTFQEEGLCYTFNMIDGKEMFTDDVYVYDNNTDVNKTKVEWSIEEGYAENSTLKSLPLRSVSAGPKSGLSVIMDTLIEDLDYVCNIETLVQGFKVKLHQPGEMARGNSQYFRIPLNQEVIMTVTPDIMSTSAALKDYNPDQRKCFFQGEKTLRFFRNYTQQNCEKECVANATLERCRCVGFHMPRVRETPICSSRRHLCMKKVHHMILTRFESKSTRDYKKDCNCLPACFSLKYYAEVSQADFEWRKFYQIIEEMFLFKKLKEAPKKHMTKISIHFKDLQFISTERHELYGSTDFLANCGGIFGLFTGFSLLSFLEIIYYLTVRIFVNKWKYGHFFTVISDAPHTKPPEDMC